MSEAAKIGFVGENLLRRIGKWDDPLDSPLRRMEGVVVTPHSAGASKQSRDRIWAMMLDNLNRLAEGRELINVVNAKDLRQPTS